MAKQTGYRSEANRFENKKNYKRYNLSRYPNNLDTREDNINMRGFINIGETKGIPDYVMAEYMNAAMDGIMSLQQAIGTEPMVYHGATDTEINNLIETFTVSERIERIENGLFDERYGGKGWSYVPNRPVLNSHEHHGKNGHPSKINLSEDKIDLVNEGNSVYSEVEGKLPHENINLDYRTGLTSAHISLSSANPSKLNTVIADLLSKSQGGRVSGNVSFTGVVKTRTSMDATAQDIINRGQSNIKTDHKATSGVALSSGSTTNQINLFNVNSNEISNLLYGRYVLGIRLKKKFDYNSNTNLLEFWFDGKYQYVQEKDIDIEFKTIHFIFELNHLSKNSYIWLAKMQSNNSQELTVDSYYITPIHPATLDI